MQEKQTSKLKIYQNIPFENSYANVIKFDEPHQIDIFIDSYFPIYETDSYQYIEKTGNILVEKNANHFINANYIRFENEGKIYYGFIMDCVYVNKETTEILYEIDVWNTYQFQLNKNPFRGDIIQSHNKKIKDSKYNISHIPQGISTGTKRTVYQKELEPLIDWLVFVLKPSIKLNNEFSLPYSFSGVYKQFRYCFIPIGASKTKTFEINGKKYPSCEIDELMKIMTNTFNDDANTVKQVINVYYTKHPGVNYRIENDIIIIENPSNNYYIHELKKGSAPIVPNDEKWNNILIDNEGRTLSIEFIRRIITECRKHKILPSVVVTQVHLESMWGDSDVGRTQNNWSGMSSSNYFDGEIKRLSGINVTCGSARPPSEGGFYYKYNTPEDWLTDYLYLLRENGIYKISGKTNFDEAVKGLFRDGGASGDYAKDGFEVYLTKMKSRFNSLSGANVGLFTELDLFCYNQNNTTSANNLITYAKSFLGEQKGREITTKYNNITGMGIPLDSDWCAMFVSVMAREKNIPLTEIPNFHGCTTGGRQWFRDNNRWQENTYVPKKGDLIFYDWNLSGDCDHVEIVDYVSNGVVFTVGGNMGSPRAVRTNKYPLTEKTISGYGQVNYAQDSENGWITTPYTDSSITAPIIYSNGIYILELLHLFNYHDLEIDLIDIQEKIIAMLPDYLDISTEKIESQLLSNEFIETKIYDGFGNEAFFISEFIPKEPNKIIISGSMGDSNHVHYTIKNYHKNPDNDETILFDKSKFQYGMTDGTPKSITILNDETTSYIQGAKNQMEAQAQAFNENQKTLQRQINLSETSVNLANQQSSYNAQFSVDSARINTYQTTANTGLGIVGNVISGNPIGLSRNLINGGFGIYDSFRNEDNALQNQQFTERHNSIRSQSNALNNMSARTALEQSIRNYNAVNKDRENMPTTIQQMGNDLSFQYGNSFDGVYFEIKFPNKRILKEANNYFNAYGILENYYSSDIREIYKNREKFNYIKTGSIQFPYISIHQTHLETLKNIFLCGVRVWNYNKMTNRDEFTDLTIKNNDL